MAIPGHAQDTDDAPFAVVDVGSNSARMIVFRLRRGEHLDVLEDARAPLRLARELRTDDELGAAAIERTLEALRDFRAVAIGAGAERMLAVATSAVRDARDGEELLRRARALGVPLEIIDGDLEAALGFLGAVHDLPVSGGLTMDVGGGSAEVSRFEERRLERSWTLRLGSLLMSDRFLERDPPSGRELDRLRRHVAATLGSASVPSIGPAERLVGIGGTIRNLAKVDVRRTEYPLARLHGYDLPAEHLEELVELFAARSMKRRARIPGLNPDRADSILGGAVVVEGIMRHTGARGLLVSSRGLREGVALGGPDGEVPAPRWVRSVSVAALGARFATWDLGAARRRTDIAVRLHETLDPEAGVTVREMLEHAATLLDVGRAIDYYDRFEHSAMIVTASDLAGFSHEGLGMLTAILRQADDDLRLGPYRRLVAAADRPAVLRAATALALADEVGRRIPPGRPASISCTWRRRAFVVATPIPSGWRPRAVAERFRQVFGRPLHVVSTETGP